MSGVIKMESESQAISNQITFPKQSANGNNDLSDECSLPVKRPDFDAKRPEISLDLETDTRRLNQLCEGQCSFQKPRKVIESNASGTLIFQKQQCKGNKNRQNKQAVNLLSALYGIILFILGLAFPLAQVISSRIPLLYYEGFYLYLYVMAIAFLAFIYILLKKPSNAFCCCNNKEVKRILPETAEPTKQDVEMKQMDSFSVYGNSGEPAEQIQTNHGSFYLRMGAVAKRSTQLFASCVHFSIVFGVGGMIYSVLDFGQYLDFSSNLSCYDAVIALSPACRVIFTFLQMYFVFLNAKMQIVKLRSPVLVQFGLMHILATNMCIWLNTIIEETNHEIHLAKITGEGKQAHENTIHSDASEQSTHSTSFLNDSDTRSRLFNHSNVLTSSHHVPCHRTELMSSIVESASPFLFPCAIEYSLICAATAYEIWSQKVGGANSEGDEVWDTKSNVPFNSRQLSLRGRRSPHHYSVDCTKANKGLFFGIFVLALTIIAMILFTVLINRDDYKSTAITEVHVAELILYGMMLFSVLIGMIQVRQLKRRDTDTLNVDEILIIVAQCGNIAYSLFTILGSQFSDHPDRFLVMMTSMAALIQGITQTIFILDAYNRCLSTIKQQQRKPGREIVTFLLVTNFAMWALSTLEKSRPDAHPLQSDFYGTWQWAIITNISTPLAIFYRYHSTVCLCEIWKSCYKFRDDLY